jgi:hypothetical protein
MPPIRTSWKAALFHVLELNKLSLMKGDEVVEVEKN